MAKTVQGTQTPGVDGVEGEKPKTKEEIQALVDAQGGPMVDPGGRHSGKVDDMLAKVGLGGVSGAQAAGGARAVDGVDKSGAAEAARTTGKLLGTETQKTEIAPPSPPKVELTPDLKVGAETFVNNIDQVVNSLVSKDGVPPENTESMAARGLPPEQVVQEIFYRGVNGDQVRAQAEGALMESETGLGKDGAVTPALGTVGGTQTAAESGGTRSDTNSDSQGGQTSGQVGGLDGARGGVSPEMEAAINYVQNGPLGEYLRSLPDNGKGPTQFDHTGTPILPPNFKPTDVFTAENFRNVAEGVLANGGTLGAGKTGMSGVLTEGDLRKISELSADMLLAMFLKLNITDPNNSPEVHNMLHSVSSELRQQGLAEAKGKNEMAALKMKNAAAYAERAKTAGTVIMIITIIISLIITIFTFGAAAGAAIALAVGVNAAVQAAVQAGIQTAMQMFLHVLQTMISKMLVMIIVAIIVTLILQLMNAAAQKEAQDQTLDAQDAENTAKKAQQWADKEQAVVEEEAAIMQLIMESKNQVIDAVMKMMNAAFATQTKVMSAGMSR